MKNKLYLLYNSLFTKVGHRVKYNEKYNVYIWLRNYNDASLAQKNWCVCTA